MNSNLSNPTTPSAPPEAVDAPLLSMTAPAPTAVVVTPAFSPLYLQIKQLILQSLQNGEWKPGDTIPSEQELTARFKVSQGTVRKAIDELASEHLLVRRQGKGTFVATHAERQIQYRFLRLQPDAGQEHANLSQRSIIECRRLRATAEVARLLGLRSADPVIFVRRVLAFGHRPTILEDIWLPGVPFKGLSQDALATDHGPMYALFESQFGVRMVRAEEKIKAVAASADAAALLQVSLHHPLLSVERLAYTYKDVPMELRRGLYVTETHHYQNQLS